MTLDDKVLGEVLGDMVCERTMGGTGLKSNPNFRIEEDVVYELKVGCPKRKIGYVKKGFAYAFGSGPIK